ncbi:MAG TPA: dCTP deaminase [Candidatus Saccharimonadales bacterium]|nr:dCTP deaminase [Candidatus Saccharimonadales bacterium]
MILSDKDIKRAIESGYISVSPYDEKNLQPASYDLHLDKHFLVFDTKKNSVIDPKKPVDNLMRPIEISENEPFVLHPGEFALGLILEETGVGDDYAGRLEGKSSVGRLGVLIHVTAGFLDPGNKLKMTLELHNTAEIPVLLYYKMPIAQIAFEKISSAAEEPYGSNKLTSKYSGDTKPVASQMWKNYNQETGEWK